MFLFSFTGIGLEPTCASLDDIFEEIFLSWRKRQKKSIMLVRIVKDWDWPDLRRQTPNQSGIWECIEFTLEPVKE